MKKRTETPERQMSGQNDLLTFREMVLQLLDEEYANVPDKLFGLEYIVASVILDSARDLKLKDQLVYGMLEAFNRHLKFLVDKKEDYYEYIKSHKQNGK